MRNSITFVFLTFLLMACTPDRPVYESLDEYPVYGFNNLGAKYTPEKTTFRLWSPAAQEARVHLYDTDDPAVMAQRAIDMEEMDGAWKAVVDEDLDGVYYTYQVKINGNWNEEATDPYARAAGTNGMRGQVIDLDETDPEGWENDQQPPFVAKTDAVLYELHVRDASIAANSGIEHKGKFLGLTERGTKTPQGVATGLDHLIEMGVTHVHLLPSFDFMSVDESKLDEPQFNWGYDPQNYNVPEGSYSTDPSDGKVRVREFKQMVQALHAAGIRVVMDVVYNHTGRSENSHFQHLIPDYFYRFDEHGAMSNASGCGNEIASDRPMVRKYIRESIAYWMEEYHVDGFRFDLMAIHDIPTMNEISRLAHEIDSTVLIYGEGWTAGDSPLPDSLKALKHNTTQLDRIAAFSDDLRDGLKGSVFHHEETGFVSGGQGRESTIRFGVVGSIPHQQVDYDSVNYSNAPWAKEPYQCINYVSCHDNHTLWDRLKISNPADSRAARERMQRLALGIVMTSQGIPFIHAGAEFCRTKGGDENSYKSPDKVNAIRYNEKRTHAETVNFVRNLITMRKAHPAFRLGSTAAVNEHLRFEDANLEDNLVVYRIQDAPGDAWSDILVVLNGNDTAKRVELPEGDWKTVELMSDWGGDAGANEDSRAVVMGRRALSWRVSVPGTEMMVLVRE